MKTSIELNKAIAKKEYTFDEMIKRQGIYSCTDPNQKDSRFIVLTSMDSFSLTLSTEEVHTSINNGWRLFKFTEAEEDITITFEAKS